MKLAWASPASLSSWTGNNPCDTTNPWLGVTCDTGGNLVTKLDLENLSLPYPIPSAISALTDLQALTLKANNLVGSIPVQLSFLTNLYYLDLGFNSLTNTMPEQLSQLVGLQYFFTNFNLLQGTMPPQLAALIHLQIAFFSANKLTGTLPSGLGPIYYGSSEHRFTVDGNPGLCGAITGFDGLNLTGTNLGQTCQGRPHQRRAADLIRW